MGQQGFGVGDLTEAVAQRFLASRRARGQRRVPTLASLAPLFGYLNDQPVLAPQTRLGTARDGLLADYRDHLVRGRGLAASTVLRYLRKSDHADAGY